MQNVNLLTGEKPVVSTKKSPRKHTKHQASKKKFKHEKKLSKGELNSLNFQLQKQYGTQE